MKVKSTWCRRAATTASEWLVDSGASFHVTSCKGDPETANQAATIDSGKLVAAQFKGRKVTTLTDMSGGILELVDTFLITNY